MPGLSEKPQKFVPVDELKTAEGLKAIISQRVDSGVITFAIVREFPGKDGMQSTGFIPENLCEATLQLVRDVKVRIEQLRREQPRTGASARR